MLDTLRGFAHKAEDGNRFVLKVVDTGKDNKFQYSEIVSVGITTGSNGIEEIRVDQARSARLLERELENKELLCVIQKREDLDFVIARIIPIAVRRILTTSINP